jgi:hypothetical protein
MSNLITVNFTAAYTRPIMTYYIGNQTYSINNNILMITITTYLVKIQ